MAKFPCNYDCWPDYYILNLIKWLNTVKTTSPLLLSLRHNLNERGLTKKQLELVYSLRSQLAKRRE